MGNQWTELVGGQTALPLYFMQFIVTGYTRVTAYMHVQCCSLSLQDNYIGITKVMASAVAIRSYAIVLKCKINDTCMIL